MDCVQRIGIIVLTLYAACVSVSIGQVRTRYREPDDGSVIRTKFQDGREQHDDRRFLLDSSQSSQVAATWTEWGSATACSVSCGGGGFAERLRNCSTGRTSDCQAASLSHTKYWEVTVCNNGPCVATWLEWSPVTCSVSCGKGTAYRFRNCSTGVDADCSGNRFAFQLCDRGTCDGTITTAPTTTAQASSAPAVWSRWSTSISCSTTCGTGYGERVRVCSTGHNSDCQGLAFDVYTCKDLPACAADGVWAPWGSWGACSVTCGTGRQMSSRTCTYQAGRPKGKDCVGSSTQFRECLQGACPVDGVWTSWGVWSDCTQTCNRGLKFRLRNCSYPDGAVHGQGCSGHGAETAICYRADCAVDGQWAQWSSWSQCSESCGGGVAFKARMCSFKFGFPHGKNCTGDSYQKKSCNTDKCAVDGVFNNWSGWGTCSKTCGTGSQYRGRVCTFPPNTPHGNNCTGATDENRDCNTNQCPVDGLWRNWGPWGGCDATCGGGTQSRDRICDYLDPTAPHGKSCDGSTNEKQICNADPCPADGQWSLWTKFTACSATCGNGTRYRIRTCKFPDDTPHGAQCMGPSVFAGDCNPQPCPVDGVWTSWTAWSTCTVSCDFGTNKRTRQCHFPDGVPHGQDCAGQGTETNVCNAFACPTTPSTTTTTLPTVPGHWSDWTSWSTCTLTCDSGTHQRQRSCTYPDHTLHGKYCPGPSNQTAACNTDHCPVDGKWTDWSAWSRCSVTCASGSRARNRTCAYHPVYAKGENCTGLDSETKVCSLHKCPVDGVWSAWSSWSTCSVTCGGATVSRSRTCTFPADTPHGTVCPGEHAESKNCSVNDCPVDGVLTSWSNWTDCTVSCGNGTRTRDRDCFFTPGKPPGANCTEALQQTDTCNTNRCPVDGTWTAWTGWNNCSRTCGTGQQERTRSCTFPPLVPHGVTCPGARQQSRDCNDNPCPIDGHWSGWAVWTTCSETCGNGTQIRSHTCEFVVGHPHGKDCVGEANETRNCNDGVCPVNGTWTAWTSWESCSVSCGGGLASRARNCSFPDGVPHGQNCSGDSVEQTQCSTQPCPVDGVWNAWSNWTDCSLTCGNGTRRRNRTCTFDPVAPHGQDCNGTDTETGVCSTTPCPVDGIWSAWSNWTACSDSCGNGTQFRKRRCEYEAGHPQGNICPGNDNENRTCNTNPCPVDGQWTAYGNWSTCSKSCDNGTQSRTRRCQYSLVAPHGADCNGTEKDVRACNTEQCPVDGHWSEWSAYGPCSASCGGGTRTKTRSCVFHDPAPHGAKCYGNTSFTDSCNDTLCPVDGHLSVWSNWTACSETCGSGKQVRGRVCEFDSLAPHGSDCTGLGALTDERTCQLSLCPVNGTWSDWSNFTTCSATCGGGEQLRRRKCEFRLGYPHGEDCIGVSNETRTCSTQECPVDGIWTTWASWGDCSLSCGGGLSDRNRTCEYTPATAPRGNNCSGDAEETKVCNNQSCPVDGTWSSWSSFVACPVTCGGGQSTRTRTCDFPAGVTRGSPCPGNQTDSQSCNAQECPVDAVWEAWTAWDACTVSCGGGVTSRTRNCTWPTTVHGNDCTGNDTDTKACSVTLCAVDGSWGDWSNWTRCSKTCNYGIRTRQRVCEYDPVAPRGVACVGQNSERGLCKIKLCPVRGQWTQWGTWGSCSVTCGSGLEPRTRKCAYAVPAAPDKIPCTGNDTENQACNRSTCPMDAVWDSWTAWDACSVSCGGGMTTRSRNCTWPSSVHGSDCTGNRTDSQTCSSTPCPTTTSTTLTTTPSTTATPTTTVTLPVTTTKPSTSTTVPLTVTTTKPSTAKPSTPATKATTPTTTAPPTTTKKPIRCNTCMGDPAFCELAFAEETCTKPEDSVCINKLANHLDGSREVVKRCGTLKECIADWYNDSSMETRCLGFDEEYITTHQFNCTFCCTTDGCNAKIETVNLYNP